MKNTVIKHTGNSRRIRTAPGLTAEKLLELLTSDEGLPVDILGLDPAGCEVVGTELVKANLLTDDTETAIWGDAKDRTIDQALAQLRTLVSTAQAAANAAQSAANSRTQSVNSSMETERETAFTINFNFNWKFCIIITAVGPNIGLFLRNKADGLALSEGIQPIPFTRTNTSLTIPNTSYYFNSGGNTVYYAAFG